MASIKLHGKVIITGEIKLLTGLHIGGASAGLDIGGIDNPIIRHPVTRQPYIPGSSLRGKLRSWLDRYYGKTLNQRIGSGEPPVYIHVCKEKEAYARCEVCRLFGITPEDQAGFEGMSPTRLIVRDVRLAPEWIEEVDKKKASMDLPYTEVKSEVTIDRITSAAVPRQNERVPAGAVFAPMEMVVNLYSAEDADLVPFLFRACELLEDDYLGGYGSRGTGKIRFRNLQIVLKGHGYYEGDTAMEHIGDNLALDQVRGLDYVSRIKQTVGG